MNPSAALATVLVDELLAGGVREAVLSPGSRNAPLSFALHAADRDGRLRLHVRIDERGAGFLALGLAAVSGVPVAVVCTSGTAAANLHPAILEARHAGVPLIAITADRPPELRDTGANQTVDQTDLYGRAVRWRHTMSADNGGGYWRATICRALAAARGTLTDDPGPVHLNVALREPLVPDASLPELTGRPGGRPWTQLYPPATAAPTDPLELAPRTLVVGGHGGPAVPPWLRNLPRIAEPSSPLWEGALTAGPWLLGAAIDRLRPDHVLVLGRPTLHRAVLRLLADPTIRVTVLTNRPQWTDVAGVAREVRTALPEQPPDRQPDQEWEDALRAADATAAAVLRVEFDRLPQPNGLTVARAMVAALPAGALLVLGSSNPVRNVALAACPRADITVHANRGVAGIDGTVSTAIGAALARRGRGYALIGDLTFLHDANALVIGPDEPRPNLTVVVLNDDGGGIFTLLEQGAPEHAGAFERIFGTPHGVDLAALCAATRTPHTRADTLTALTSELTSAEGSGVRVVEVPTNRAELRELHQRLCAAVHAALNPR